MKTSERLMMFRLLRDMQAKDAAKELGITAPTLVNVETNPYYEPTEERLEAMSKLYGVDVDALTDPTRTPLEVIGEENVMPNVTRLVKNKNQVQLAKENEIFKLGSVPEKVKQLLSLYQINQTELMKATGLSRKGLHSVVVTGTTHKRYIARVAIALGVDPAALLFQSPLPFKQTSESVDSNNNELSFEEEAMLLPAGDRVKLFRERAELSKEELAKAVGITPTQLQGIESSGNASSVTQKKLADFFGTTRAILFGDSLTRKTTSVRSPLEDIDSADPLILTAKILTLFAEITQSNTYTALDMKELQATLGSLYHDVKGAM